MGYVLNLNENKVLTLYNDTTTYVGENNADVITCFLPTHFNEYDLKDCFVILHIIIPDSTNPEIISGDTVELNIEEDMFKNKYVSHFDISNIYTQKAQTVYLKIEILNSDSIVAYSNEVSFEVKPHHTIVEALPNNGLEIFEQYLLEIKTLRDECIAIKNDLLNSGGGI